MSYQWDASADQGYLLWSHPDQNGKPKAAVWFLDDSNTVTGGGYIATQPPAGWSAMSYQWTTGPAPSPLMSGAAFEMLLQESPAFSLPAGDLSAEQEVGGSSQDSLNAIPEASTVLLLSAGLLSLLAVLRRRRQQ